MLKSGSLLSKPAADFMLDFYMFRKTCSPLGHQGHLVESPLFSLADLKAKYSIMTP